MSCWNIKVLTKIVHGCNGSVESRANAQHYVTVYMAKHIWCPESEFIQCGMWPIFARVIMPKDCKWVKYGTKIIL